VSQHRKHRGYASQHIVANYLRDNGFPNARYVIDGFQGPAIKEGPQAGFRLLSGWQNSNLPWSPKMNAEKMYRP